MHHLQVISNDSDPWNFQSLNKNAATHSVDFHVSLFVCWLHISYFEKDAHDVLHSDKLCLHTNSVGIMHAVHDFQGACVQTLPDWDWTQPRNMTSQTKNFVIQVVPL